MTSFWGPSLVPEIGAKNEAQKWGPNRVPRQSGDTVSSPLLARKLDPKTWDRKGGHGASACIEDLAHGTHSSADSRLKQPRGKILLE